MLSASKGSVSPLWIFLGVVLLLIVFLGGWMILGYNGLIAGRENVRNKWAQIETTYQRRFDLIPNLVNSVKGASKFEQETFLQVTQARSGWMNAGSDVSAKVTAAQQLDTALSGLRINVENYPNLQATQAYRDLMTELEGTENRIGIARKDYNDAVMTYNVQVQRFPGSVLAGLFGFGPEKPFQATAAAAQAPAVQF